MMEFCGADNDLITGAGRFFGELDRLIEQKDARNDRARGKVPWRRRMIAREPNFLRLPHVSENAALPHELQYRVAGQFTHAITREGVNQDKRPRQKSRIDAPAQRT